MATAILLSHHSSNPLDRGSSDTSASKLQNISIFQNHSQSSDDPLFMRSGPDAQMREFVQHIENIHPAAAASMKKQINKGPVKPRKTARNAIALEDDGRSDELQLQKESRRVEKSKASVTEMLVDEDVDEQGLGYDGGEVDVDLESSSDPEEHSLSQKPPEEQEEILAEIDELEDTVPGLSSDYKLIDRLGTGTFSSVYKALDLYYHNKWYNVPWHGHHHTSSSAHYQSAARPTGSKVYVAVKRIYVTSSPERIRNEIAILDECRSCRHVSQLITAFRKNDQVVLIMPYQKNDDFRDYFTALPMAAIKSYMRCLFRALRDIHTRGVIHRDVKPANFLYDPRTGIGTLCDFGLACRMDLNSQHNSLCLHTPPTKAHPHGEQKKKQDYDRDHYKQMGKEAKLKSSRPSEEVGYLDKDPRPHSKANRAGTRGFRAPEVLLKCADQSGAIDVWSAGMILLFFFTKKFPLFQSNDDVEALMEIAAIIGRRNMEQAACLHSRTFATNVPSIAPDGISWSSFIQKQNPDLWTVPEPDVRFYPYTQQLMEQAEKQLEQLDSSDDDRSYYDSERMRDENEDGEPDGYRLTPIPSSSPSHLSINTKLANPSSASSLAFPSSSPKSVSMEADAESGEMSPLTPIEDDEDSNSLQSPISLHLEGPTQEQHDRDVRNALNLVEKLLHPWSTKRITPRDALYHPFLYHTPMDDPQRRREVDPLVDEDTDMDSPDLNREGDGGGEEEADVEDDEFFPHPFGEGVCRQWHFCDEVGTQYVYVYPSQNQDEADVDAEGDPDDDYAYFASGSRSGTGSRQHGHGHGHRGRSGGRSRTYGGEDTDQSRKQMIVRRLASGEGIAIGKQPCEFHAVGYELEMLPLEPE